MNSPISWRLGDWRLHLRPVRPDDEALWLQLMRSISWATRYQRGARRVEELSPEDRRGAVTLDPATQIAFVAVAERGDETMMVGINRGTLRAEGTWEFALMVLDDWQRRGVGRRLMHALIEALRERGAQVVEGDVLALNRNMLDFVVRLGFEIRPHPESRDIRRVVRGLSA